MSAQHTPTPWRVGRPGTVVSDSHIEHGPGGCDCVEYYGGHLIAESVTSANARRIVACVNVCDFAEFYSEPLRHLCDALNDDRTFERAVAVIGVAGLVVIGVTL